MSQFKIVPIQEHAGLAAKAAEWFHQKWGIPQGEYAASIEACLRGETAVPQWYLALCGAEIIAGLGVIENDFHNRKDLAPNVCGLYVEAAYRKRGVAGKLLRFVCADFAAKGVDTLYLITDHTSFYERYGWKFCCMVQGDGEAFQSRMYQYDGKRGLPK